MRLAADGPNDAWEVYVSCLPVVYPSNRGQKPAYPLRLPPLTRLLPKTSLST